MRTETPVNLTVVSSFQVYLCVFPYLLQRRPFRSSCYFENLKENRKLFPCLTSPSNGVQSVYHIFPTTCLFCNLLSASWVLLALCPIHHPCYLRHSASCSRSLFAVPGPKVQGFTLHGSYLPGSFSAGRGKAYPQLSV